MSGWTEVYNYDSEKRKRLPTEKDCGNGYGFLCFVRMNDMGDPVPWYQVLHFDFKKNLWCCNDPLSCRRGKEEYLSDWHYVTHWRLLPELPK